MSESAKSISGNWLQQWATQILMCCVCIHLSVGKDPIASKEHSKNSEKAKRRCPYSLRKLWQTDISSFPFASAPIIADIDGDLMLDIVVAPFGETITVLEGETGKHLQDSGWPQHNLDRSIHSSPIQYDIDGDGILDLLLITSKGEGIFYSKEGYQMHRYSFQLEPAYVKANWFDSKTAINLKNIQGQVSQEPIAGHIPVDPHVFDTPTLHNKRYLVIPLSFFFSDDDYSKDESGPWGSDPQQKDNYYLTAVAILDLKAVHSSKTDDDKAGAGVAYSKIIFLELYQTPVMNLFSPTVADLDGDFSSPEIVVASTSGSLFMLTWEGQHRQGFPQTLASISGPVTAANLDSTSGLQLVVTDKSGNVTCIDAASATHKWSTAVGGTIFAGSRAVDVNLDGQVDIVLATSEGKVYALNGASGEVIPNYPYQASSKISGHVLVTKFNKIRSPYDLVFISDDGILNILASDHSCHTQMALADTSWVQLLLHDLSPHSSRGAEILVATSDGSLVCLGSGQVTPSEELFGHEAGVLMQRLAVPGPHSNALFSMERGVVLLEDWMKYINEVTGRTLEIHFTIYSMLRGERFNLRVYMGSELVYKEDGLVSGESSHSVSVQTPEKPGQAQVTVLIYDRHGYTSQDSLHLRFNQLILLDLQWLVLSPFIAMIIILLVNHGFPAKDLLPVTFPLKSK